MNEHLELEHFVEGRRGEAVGGENSQAVELTMQELDGEMETLKKLQAQAKQVPDGHNNVSKKKKLTHM